jgi:hypothetical protein
MKFIYTLMILALSTGLAKAEVSTFMCKGKNYFVSGKNLYAPANSSSESTFDLIVDSKSPNIYGYPNYIVMACLEPTSGSCSINSISLTCECQGLGKATLNLSRNSGKLSVIQTFSKQQPETITQGEYMCSRVTKKLF